MVFYSNIWDILMVNVTIYSIHGSYGYEHYIANAVPSLNLHFQWRLLSPCHHLYLKPQQIHVCETILEVAIWRKHILWEYRNAFSLHESCKRSGLQNHRLSQCRDFILIPEIDESHSMSPCLVSQQWFASTPIAKLACFQAMAYTP